jgi:RHS repeat-associated protein
MLRLRFLFVIVLAAGCPLAAQSYQSRFEQVKFDREGAGGSKAGVVTVDGATGAASVDLPLGPGIGGNGLHFTPAVRLRSTALSWTQTNVVDPNAYMGTPPFLWATSEWAGGITAATVLSAQTDTQTLDFTTGGSGGFSPGSLELVLPDSRNRTLSTVTYPDGGSSTLGAASYPNQSFPNGYVPSGVLPSGASDPTLALTAFQHGPSAGWTVAKLPYYLDTYNGVVTSVPASPSGFIQAGSGGELVVGLQSAAAPMVGVPEPDMPTHVMQIPPCVLVIRGDVAYEYAYVGTLGGSMTMALPRTVNNPDGRTRQWLASAHYLLTGMLNRFGDAIVFDHGVSLLGQGTSGVTGNGFDYTARWVRNGVATGVSVSLALGTAVTVPAYPTSGGGSSTAATQAQVSYAGMSPAPAYGLTFGQLDGGPSPMTPGASLAFYQANGMVTAWDAGSESLLPLSVTDPGTQETVSFTYGSPGVGLAPVLTQVNYPNGRQQTFTWGSYAYRPNLDGAVWGGYRGDPGRKNAQAWGVTQVRDADTVLNGYSTRMTTHTRVVPQPDPTNLTGWTSTSFYDGVTHPDGSVTVFFYVEPVQGGAASLQTLCNLQQQVREVREYRDGSTWQSDVSVAASSSSADRITVYDHWDLRGVANPAGDLSILGGHPYSTRTRAWDKESGVLTLTEKTAWDATAFAWGASTRQSYVSVSTPGLGVDYPSLASGGSAASYPSLQRKTDGAATATFDAARWVGPLTTWSQGTVSADATADFTAAGGAAPSAQPPTSTAFVSGTALPQTVTVGTAGTGGLQVQTAFTYAGGSAPTAPTPLDATLSDPAGAMVNSGLVGAGYSYDGWGRLNAIQPKGVGWKAQQAQDALGRVTSQTGADGVVTTYAWDGAGRLASVQVGSELPTVYAYDDTSHRKVTVTRGSQVSELRYDAFGELILERRRAQGTDAFKIYGRDAMGRVTGETLWLPATVNGHTVTDADAFQPNLLMDTVTTTPGYEKCMKWDLVSGTCMTWKTVPPTTTTHPAMYKGTQTAYDGLGRVGEVKGPHGEDTLTAYGSWSMGSQVQGAQVIRTAVGAQVWNPATGTATATNLSTTFQHDAEGRLAHVIDGAGQTTDYLYDVAGRIAQVTQHGSVNQVRTWSYDALGRVTALTQPESGTTSYGTFTVTGKATATTYGGSSPRTLWATLDPLDRVTGLTSSDASVTQSFSYADAGSGLATGKLTSATSNGVTRTLTYAGPAGELTSLTQTVDGQSFSLSLGYDASYGFLNSRTYPDGKVQTVSADLERGLPSGSSFNGATVASLGYDGISWQLTGLTTGNNGTSVFGYVNERLATMAHAIPGMTLASWAFSYDQAGQLLTDSEDAYGYDSLGRLTQAEVRDPQDAASGHGLQQVMSYDAFGNRISLSSQKVTNWTTPTSLPTAPTLTALAAGDTRVQSYAMTAGEIASMGATNRLPSTVGGVATGAAYDAQGNLTQIWGIPGTSSSQLTMTYDSLGRVASLGDTANATSQTYGYDDEGLRIKVLDSKTGLVKYNVYDESRHLIAQYEVPSGGSLTWKKDLLYVGDKEVAEVDSSGKTWVEFLDHLGSPRFEWDGTASPVTGTNLILQKYAPFGEYLNDPTTQVKFAKGFTNHEQTDASGLIYMQARFYAPMYGRFLSPDPARDQHFEQTQSWNIYSYVSNNPTMLIDQNGMQAAPAAIVGGHYYYRSEGGGYRVTNTALRKTGWVSKIPQAPRAASGRIDDDSGSILSAVFAVSGGKALLKLGSAMLDTLTGKEALNAGSKLLESDSSSAGQKTFQTYTKTNPETGEVYSGRTSGTGTPEQNVAGRDAGHHMNEQGFGPAELDKSSTNPDAIRGREQQLIDANGGAKSQGGTSGNRINGVSDSNPKKPEYMDAAKKEFQK